MPAAAEGMRSPPSALSFAKPKSIFGLAAGSDKMFAGLISR
jgi:hypothetical protein